MNLVIILGEILNIEYKIIDKGKVYAIAFSEIKIEMEKTKIKVIFKKIKMSDCSSPVPLLLQILSFLHWISFEP